MLYISVIGPSTTATEECSQPHAMTSFCRALKPFIAKQEEIMVPTGYLTLAP